MIASDPLDVAQYGYIPIFAGRTDTYAAWSGDHWQRIRGPLAPSVVVEAWQAKQPLSFYLLGPDSRGHVAAFDFDTEDGLEQAFQVGQAIGNAYVEPSRRGAHLWIIATERLTGIVLRRALRAWLQDAGIADDPHIEIFPKQEVVTDVGFCLRGPLQPHPMTGMKALLLDPFTRKPIGRSVAEVCLAVEQVTGVAFRDAAERYQPPELVPVVASGPHDGPIARFNESVTVTAVLARNYGIQATPGRTTKCPKHEDRNASLSIARDDRRAWCHAPACELYTDGRGVDAYDLWRVAQGMAA